MQNNNALHIIVPGLCGPLAQTQALESSKELKTWINLLAKAKSSSFENNFYGVVSSLFKLKHQDEFPSATLTFLNNASYNASKHYMFADPVHLQADMDHAVLTAGCDLAISDEESAVLCQSLNQHFNQDGLEFFVLENNRWVVSANSNIKMTTTPLTEAVGRNINFILPDGEDSRRWRQLLTEAQMLMHAHDVNVERENTSSPILNSLWFHGSGDISGIYDSSKMACDVKSVCSDDVLLKGLASVANCDYIPLPATADEYLEQILAYDGHSTNVLHLSKLEYLVNYSDVTPWLNATTTLLNEWLYPLLKNALDNGITVTLYDCNKQKFQFSKYDSLRFWRMVRHVLRGYDVGHYVDSY